MRFGAGFGILSLLVVAAIAIVWFSQTQIPVARQGKTAQDQARAISGREQDGRPLTETFKVEGVLKNGKTSTFKVKSIDAGGAVAQQFDLQTGDEIVQVGDYSVEMANGDEELVAGQIVEAYRGSRPIVIRRNGETMTLKPKGNGLPNQLGPVNIPLH